MFSMIPSILSFLANCIVLTLVILFQAIKAATDTEREKEPHLTGMAVLTLEGKCKNSYFNV